jgi:hypothetical protein
MFSIFDYNHNYINMKKAVVLYLFPFTLFLFFICSCTADKEETIIDECGLENISFSSDIQPILEASCINCHNSSYSNGGIILDSYEDAQDAADDGRLLGAVKHEAGYTAMPPSGKLDSCQIARIEEWIDKGFPE